MSLGKKGLQNLLFNQLIKLKSFMFIRYIVIPILL